jgi:uroporphyrinogen-III synthase
MNVLLTKPSILSEYLQQRNIAHQTVKMFDYRRTMSLVFLRQVLTSNNYDLVVLPTPSAIDIYLKCEVVNKLACISPASSAKLSQFQPLHLNTKPYDGKSLAHHIIHSLPAKDTRILILTGADGQNALFEILSNYYPNVKKLEIYERILPEYDRESLETVFYGNVFDTVVVTCNTAIKNLLYYINKYYLQFNLDCNLIVPSQRIAEFAVNNNFKNIILAESVDEQDILAKILAMGG